jgi:hypothetical protein
VEGGGWRVEAGGWRLEGRGWRVEGAPAISLRSMCTSSAARQASSERALQGKQGERWRVDGGGWRAEGGGWRMRIASGSISGGILPLQHLLELLGRSAAKLLHRCLRCSTRVRTTLRFRIALNQNQTVNPE